MLIKSILIIFQHFQPMKWWITNGTGISLVNFRLIKPFRYIPRHSYAKNMNWKTVVTLLMAIDIISIKIFVNSGQGMFFTLWVMCFLFDFDNSVNMTPLIVQSRGPLKQWQFIDLTPRANCLSLTQLSLFFIKDEFATTVGVRRERYRPDM